MTDRATSTMLSYTLTLTIITLLVSGIFVAGSGFVEDQHERTIRAELEVVGNRLASDLAAVDRLALADDSSSIRLTIDLPEHVAGNSYRLAFTELGDGRKAIDLSTDDPVIDVSVTVKLSSTLAESDLSGGDVVIVYNGSSVEVRHD